MLGHTVSRHSEILIIGGGIIGISLAAALCAEGVSVRVLEAAASCGVAGATAAGMGHLVVMDDNPAELALTRYSCELWRQQLAQQDAAAAQEYSNCGTLWLAADDEEWQAAQTKAQLLRAHGVACELLDAQALAAAEPQLRPGLAGALRVSGDGIVYPPKSVRWLQAQCGARLQVEQAQVSALLWQGAHCIGATDAQGRCWQAGAVVVANGMGALTLLPQLPLRAKRGMLAISDRYPDFVRHQLVELAYIKNAHASDGDSIAFNVQPRPSGQLLLGSSRQYDRSDRQLDHALLSRMLTHACHWLPGLAQLQLIRCWSGVRCASADGLPLLGPHPQHPGLWLACGHEGLGITTAPASAALLAAQLCGATCALPIDDYLPARFATLQADAAALAA